MSNEELIAENSKLKEENSNFKEEIKQLKELLKRKSGSNSRAYEEIRAMIIAKVNKEVEVDLIDGIERDWTRKRAEKQIMSDLKWDLRVRRIAQKRWQEYYHKTKEDFIKKYGKSYI